MKQENYAVIHDDEIIFIGTHEQAKSWLDNILGSISFYNNRYGNQKDISKSYFLRSFKIINLRQYYNDLSDNWVTWDDWCDVAF